MNLRGTGGKRSCSCQIQEGRETLNLGAGSEERGPQLSAPFLPANSNEERDKELKSHLVSGHRSDIWPRAPGRPEQGGVQAQGVGGGREKPPGIQLRKRGVQSAGLGTGRLAYPPA